MSPDWTVGSSAYNQTITYTVQSNQTTAVTLQQLRYQVLVLQQQYPPPLPPVQPAVRVRPPAGFNRYVNASDLVEDFIAFAGAEGVRQGDVLGLPVELFVKWLVIRACEEEQADPGVTLALPRRAQPRCLGCQRWMRRGVTVPLHDERCAGLYFRRAA